jgi:hypothetical protein
MFMWFRLNLQTFSFFIGHTKSIRMYFWFLSFLSCLVYSILIICEHSFRAPLLGSEFCIFLYSLSLCPSESFGIGTCTGSLQPCKNTKGYRSRNLLEKSSWSKLVMLRKLSVSLLHSLPRTSGKILGGFCSVWNDSFLLWVFYWDKRVAFWKLHLSLWPIVTTRDNPSLSSKHNDSCRQKNSEDTENIMCAIQGPSKSFTEFMGELRGENIDDLQIIWLWLTGNFGIFPSLQSLAIWYGGRGPIYLTFLGNSRGE